MRIPLPGTTQGRICRHAGFDKISTCLGSSERALNFCLHVRFLLPELPSHPYCRRRRNLVKSQKSIRPPNGAKADRLPGQRLDRAGMAGGCDPANR